MNWTEFECIEQIFQSQSADEQIEQWKLRPQQTEVFNSALAVFRAIGSKLRAEQLCIPFFGLKESLLLRLASVVTEKPMEDFTLVLIYGPPKKYKIIITINVVNDVINVRFKVSFNEVLIISSLFLSSSSSVLLG